jgi:hypothetical protein
MSVGISGSVQEESDSMFSKDGQQAAGEDGWSNDARSAFYRREYGRPTRV